MSSRNSPTERGENLSSTSNINPTTMTVGALRAQRLRTSVHHHRMRNSTEGSEPTPLSSMGTTSPSVHLQQQNLHNSSSSVGGLPLTMFQKLKNVTAEALIQAQQRRQQQANSRKFSKATRASSASLSASSLRPGGKKDSFSLSIDGSGGKQVEEGSEYNPEIVEHQGDKKNKPVQHHHEGRVSAATNFLSQQETVEAINKSAFYLLDSARKEQLEGSPFFPSSTSLGVKRRRPASVAAKVNAQWAEHYNLQATAGEGGQDQAEEGEEGRLTETGGKSMQKGVSNTGMVDNSQPLHVAAKLFLDRQKYHLKCAKNKSNQTESLELEGGFRKERDEAGKLFLIYRDLINLFAEKLHANLGPIFKEVAMEMTNFLELFQTMSKQLTESHQMINDFEESFVNRTDEIRSQVLREVKSMFKTSIQKEQEGEIVHRVTVELERKLTNLKATEEKQMDTIKTQNTLVKELSRELRIKASMLNEIQKKTNEVIIENRYLRGICAHNSDLLKEIDLRRQAQQLQLESHTEETQKLRAEINSLNMQKLSFHNHQKGLKDVIRSQEDEITLLKQGHAELVGLYGQVKNERDDYLDVYTPRPDSGAAVHWLKEAEHHHGYGYFQQYVESHCQPAGSAFGHSSDETGGHKLHSSKKEKVVKKIPTHSVVRCLLQYTEDIQNELNGMKGKLQLQAKLVEFLAEDDFEKLQRVSTNAALNAVMMGGHGYNGPVVATGRKQPGGSKEEEKVALAMTTAGSSLPVHKTALATFQVHSRCVSAFGTHDLIPKHLRYNGYVAIRAMPVDEVLILIDELRNERTILRSKGEKIPLDFSEYIENFFATRYGNGQQEKDLIYSFEYSCSLSRFAPQVDLWVKMASGLAPESLFEEAIFFLRKILDNMKVFITKQGTPIEKKRRCVKRKVLFDYISKIIPWFSDAEMVRLRAILHDETQNVERMMRQATGGGHASPSKKEAAKDDVPIELLMDPEVELNPQYFDDTKNTSHFDEPTTTQQKARESDGASGGSAMYAPTGVSMLSPFACAIFRAFVNEYETHRNDIVSEVWRRARVECRKLQQAAVANSGGGGNRGSRQNLRSGPSKAALLPNNLLQRSGSLFGSPTPSGGGGAEPYIPLEDIEVNVSIFAASLRQIDTLVNNEQIEYLVGEIFPTVEEVEESPSTTQQLKESTSQSPSTTQQLKESTSQSPFSVMDSETSSPPGPRRHARGRRITFEERLNEKYCSFSFSEFYSKICQIYFTRTVVVQTNLALQSPQSGVEGEDGTTQQMFFRSRAADGSVQVLASSTTGGTATSNLVVSTDRTKLDEISKKNVSNLRSGVKQRGR